MTAIPTTPDHDVRLLPKQAATSCLGAECVDCVIIGRSRGCIMYPQDLIIFLLSGAALRVP